MSVVGLTVVGTLSSPGPTEHAQRQENFHNLPLLLLSVTDKAMQQREGASD